MSHVFRPGQRVKIISFPWDGYCDGVASIGDTVTIHSIKPAIYTLGELFAVLEELLLVFPEHNIGTNHLKLAPHQSRNKREGKYLVNRKGV